jgi:hypothetical protein
MINGFEYSWEDISISLLKRLITGFTAIEYAASKEHMNIHGRGANPVAMGRGRKTYQGSITMLQSEVEAIQAGLPKGKDLTDLAPFKVIVAYAPEGGAITTDELLYCRFTNLPKGMNEGDGNMMVALPLVIGNINYNV